MGEHDRTLILFLFWLISKSYNFFLSKLTNLNILEKIISIHIYIYIYIYTYMYIYIYI